MNLKKARIAFRIIVLCPLFLALAGCEVQTLYGIELLDFDDDERWKEVQGSDYTLYLSTTNHTELPGIYLVALANDRPTDPPWDWEEFQSWSPDKKASVFGSYYDQTYRDLSVSHESTCPARVESFDHRGAAEETEYGRWLRGWPKRNAIDDHSRGVFVAIPVADCNQPGGVEELAVIVGNGHDGDDHQIKVSIRVNVVDTSVQWLF